MAKKSAFNSVTQFIIPSLTIASMLAISLKYPQWGLLINLVAQPFWLYSGWKAYKKAGQIGIFVTTIIVTVTITFGLINYWILS